LINETNDLKNGVKLSMNIDKVAYNVFTCYLIAKNLEELVRQKQHPVYYLLTVRAGIQRENAELEWSKEAIKLM
jgi:hypothetical protein